MRHVRVCVPNLAIPNSSNNHRRKMPANKNTMPGPSAPKQTAADLEAELAAMEAKEAAEVKRKQEWEEKKKKLAELAEAKKAEEAVAAAVRKAVASAKKVEKRRVEGPAEDEGSSKKKKTQEDGEEDMDEVAQVVCRKCVSYIFFIASLLTISIDAITNK